MSAAGAFLLDGRLHLHHGPIDLIISATGPGAPSAYRSAGVRFRTILDELVCELPVLRAPFGAMPQSPVGLRMARAVARFSEFVTPMAAVAGAVADEICETMQREDTPRIEVNNGGDISFHLAPGEIATALGPAGPIRVRASDPVRGIATSGWRGRSHSLGIADAVTVLAENAAAADAAATLIANAVNLPGHPAIERVAARVHSPDSDLGDLPVTTQVGPLSSEEIARALAAGAHVAEEYLNRGLIHAAILLLNGRTSMVSHVETLTKDLTDA